MAYDCASHIWAAFEIGTWVFQVDFFFSCSFFPTLQIFTGTDVTPQHGMMFRISMHTLRDPTFFKSMKLGRKVRIAKVLVT
jgi:hypothetical protein